MSRLQNLLLVYPEVPSNTYWSYKYALRFAQIRSAMPPLGLITIASFIPEHYNLKLVDLNVTPLADEDIRWADAVFISAMLVQKDAFLKVVNTCNTHNTPVIAGGPYATTYYQNIIGVDHFVLGEVEDILHLFLADLQNNRARKVYAADERPDISRAKPPRFDLLDLSAYSTMSIQYSRGCPFRCEFCDIWKVYGNRPRLKLAETVIRELDALFKLGWRGTVFIVDDNFIGNKKRVKKELLPALVKWQKDHGHVYQFFTEASINLADDPQLLAGMRDSGFTEVFIGIETPSAASLKETGKTQNLKTDLSRAVRTVQNFGIEVMAGFILGFDSDTADIFDRQIDFIEENGIPRAMVGLLNALPGTDLFDKLQQEDRILGDCEGNNTHQMTTNFKTRMDAELLKEGYLKVIATLYGTNLKNYFTRCSRLFDNLGDTAHYSRDIHLNEIRILLRSILTQPFTLYGVQYAKFILRNLFKHPQIFGEVVRFAIIGHHFHTITRETLKAEAVVTALEGSYRDLREQLSVCLETMKVNSQEACRHARLLWKGQKKNLEEIRKKIDRIHEDFRGDMLGKYADVSEKIALLFSAFPGSAIEQPSAAWNNFQP